LGGIKSEEFNPIVCVIFSVILYAGVIMFAKRSQVLKNIENKLSIGKPQEQQAKEILELIELFMEPKLRPLTEKEVDDHILVKQVHESRKDEVRNYVRNLDYEMKREFVPEDT
jgi:hypothetical protein